VKLLQRLGMSRTAASGTLVIVMIASFATVVGIAASRFTEEATTFYRDVMGEPYAPREKRKDFERGFEGEKAPPPVLESTLKDAAIVFADLDGNGRYTPGYAEQAVEKLHAMAHDSALGPSLKKGLAGLSQIGPKLAESAKSVLVGIVESGRSALEGALGILTLTILFPIYLYYSLANLGPFYDAVVRHLPASQRPRIVDILGKVDKTISAFFRGRLITMFIKGCLLLGLFVVLGVPFALVCAAFAAVASLVPLVGGPIALLPPLLLFLPEGTGGEVWALVIGVVVIELIEGYVLIPKLVGGSVGLHSLTVLVCTLVAGSLLGVFGMVVAVPLTAVLKILAAEFVLPEVRRRAGLPPTDVPGAAD
jgi:predicted PurR-regulated permease PerM